MRPKHILWTLVAVIGSAWYALDPQAHTLDPRGRALDRVPARVLVGARAAAAPAGACTPRTAAYAPGC